MGREALRGYGKRGDGKRGNGKRRGDGEMIGNGNKKGGLSGRV